MIDLIIVCAYFVVIFVAAILGRQGSEASVEDYFLSSRNLKWYSIALSTIATNVQGYQFLGMMGSAYLFGLAQANLEINAIQGLLMAAFIFVPLYLKDRVITITQFIKKRLGKVVGLFYTVSNIILFSTMALGAALFWGAYAAELVFGDFLSFISNDRITRIAVLIFVLGAFSATYTYFGGLAAVVKTDIIQFTILLAGGIAVLFVAIHHLGGWSELYAQTPDLMHLHLPANHSTLPWISIGGMFLLNINYWCANQVVIQRSLAAKSLKEAQIGLMVGGVMKYFMAIIIIVPGIALAGILKDNALQEPDMTFPYLVTNYLPSGMVGLILCALFASLMSTVDSTFNSLATLWSIDIYKVYINKNATEQQIVSTGRKTIIFTLFTGVIMGFVLLYLKFDNPDAAFTHTLNELRYYINSGIVMLICSAAFLVAPKYKLIILAFLLTIPFNLSLKYAIPEMNYFVRAMFVIVTSFLVVATPTSFRTGWQPIEEIVRFDSKLLKWAGLSLLISLLVVHVIFH